MTVNSQRLLLAAAGEAAGEGLYVDEVFSTFLVDGAGGQTITNGIDLSTEGGMVWSKARAVAASWGLHDTERGVNKFLSSNSTAAEIDVSGTTNFHTITSFNTDGFTTGNDGGYGIVDLNGYGSYAHFTFRKAPGFFDVVTYTGNGTAGRTVAHNLGSVPGCILVKNVSRTGTDWRVWHRSLTSNSYTLLLNLTNGEINSGAGSWNNTAPTSTNFTVGADNDVNFNGDTHVAYIFAHDDQSFGKNGDESIIKCGSFTTDGSSSATINLGFEPQWLLYKRKDASGENWQMLDVMRGWSDITSGAEELRANDSTAESTNNGNKPTSTGFKLDAGHSNNATYVYVAIRRPHKPPEAGTDVFAATTDNSQGDGRYSYLGKPVDAWWYHPNRSGGSVFNARQRLTGGGYLVTSTQAALVSQSINWWDNNVGTGSGAPTNTNAYSYGWRRAPGFFDVVPYTGIGSATTVNHNLGVAPELLIVKDRSSVRNWFVWVSGFGVTDYLELNNNNAKLTGANIWNSTAPTSTVFSVNGVNNTSSNDFIVYLFASLANISKIGTYTGTGSNVGVNCGFTAGARFVLIKRTDSAGDWYVYDSTRGIIGGNDPYLLVNSNAAEVTNTDYIDPLNSGFTVTSSAPAALNASGGTYIFLAIA